MTILSLFTDHGTPKTGLSPVLKIVDVATGNILITSDPMIEVSDGWYKYDFSIYDYTKEYIVVCDGGDVLEDTDRYISSALDNSNLDMAKVVWNAKVSSFQTTDSFGALIKLTSDNLKRSLGLMHENIYIDEPIYDENNNLVSARVRIYSDGSSVGTTNNIIGTYLISSIGSGAGKFTNWSQVLV